MVDHPETLLVDILRILVVMVDHSVIFFFCFFVRVIVAYRISSRYDSEVDTNRPILSTMDDRQCVALLSCNGLTVFSWVFARNIVFELSSKSEIFLPLKNLGLLFWFWLIFLNPEYRSIETKRVRARNSRKISRSYTLDWRSCLSHLISPCCHLFLFIFLFPFPPFSCQSWNCNDSSGFLEYFKLTSSS